jgi:hypothetical protein
MPDNWPCYDVIAQPKGGGPPQRVSVKSRTFSERSDDYVVYNANDEFDWLAIVQLPGADLKQRRIFIIPRTLADERARRNKPNTKYAHERYWSQVQVSKLWVDFENNFCLSRTGLAMT